MKSQKANNSKYNLNKRGKFAFLGSKITRCLRKLDVIGTGTTLMLQNIETEKRFSFTGA